MAQPSSTELKRTDDSAGSEHNYPRRPHMVKKTDLTKWRCKDDEGRLSWHYLGDDEQAAKEWPQTYADKYYLGLPLVRSLLSPRSFPLRALSAIQPFSDSLS